MWDDIQEWFANLDPEKKKVLTDAMVGQAGVEGKGMDYFGLSPNAIRETTPSTEEIAANPDLYAYRGGELLAGLPPPTPLEEKGAYMQGRGGYDAAVTEMNAPKKSKKDSEDMDDFYAQLFMQSLVENLSGGKPGQAPGVVLGGRSGGLPSMMGQFQRQRKPWWIV